jgi:hypothetical protein
MRLKTIRLRNNGLETTMLISLIVAGAMALSADAGAKPARFGYQLSLNDCTAYFTPDLAHPDSPKTTPAKPVSGRIAVELLKDKSCSSGDSEGLRCVRSLEVSLILASHNYGPAEVTGTWEPKSDTLDVGGPGVKSDELQPPDDFSLFITGATGGSPKLIRFAYIHDGGDPEPRSPNLYRRWTECKTGAITPYTPSK